ncbi:MAG: hypothetical protein LBR64_04700 [Dysgonamonadaceae bacterium]|jgi:hypothetical protein|nr:hypothetical protein [Dysgonamonadaceae bacterium]
MKVYFAILVLINALILAFMSGFGSRIFPENTALIWTYTAVALLFILESIIILTTERKSRTITPAQSVNLFMELKIGKILLSVAFLLVYAIAVGVETKRFLLVFLALYLVYLAFDTFYLTSRERALKNEKNNNR